jgi:hypothetical protein
MPSHVRDFRDQDVGFEDIELDFDLDLDELSLDTPPIEDFRGDPSEDDISDFDFVGGDGPQTLAPESDDFGFSAGYSRGSQRVDPTKEYWARQGDPDSFIASLDSKVEQFRNYQRSSAYWRWLIKNWQYYSNLYFDDQIDSIGVSALGEMGELVGYAVNHFRNLLQHLLTLTTRDRPALIVRAKNSDARSLIQSRLGKSVLESYWRDKQAEIYYKNAVEHALVFGQGFLVITWEPQIGEILGVDDKDNFSYEGDLHFENPTAWDVFYDLGVPDWKRQDWVIIRSYENKWNLIARHPDKKDAILAAQNFPDSYDDTNRPLLLENEIYQDTDNIEVFKFFHRQTDAIPAGRMAKYVPGAVLTDTALPYRRLPVLRTTPGELLLSPFGYTPAFDLQAPQEIVNLEASSIASNHKSFGIQNVWTRTGDDIGQSELEGGLNHVQSEEPPQALNLTNTPPEVFEFYNMTVQAMEYLSGVNSVSRGQPDAMRAASGAALALIDAKSVQFSSSLIQSYHAMIEDGGTLMLEILRDFAQTDRVVSIIGKWNQSYVQEFRGSDLSEIDRVTVETTNPVLNTFAGRIELADKLLASQLLTTPEEYINVIQTGQVESLLEAETAQLAKIRSENEALMEGQPVEASPYDNHVLHIKECHSLINSRDAAYNEDLVAGVAAHISDHVFLLENMEVQKILTVLGYPVPIPPTYAMPLNDPQAQPVPLQGLPGGGGAAPTGRPPGGAPGTNGGNLMAPPNGMDPGLDARSRPRLPSMPAQAGGQPVER